MKRVFMITSGGSSQNTYGDLEMMALPGIHEEVMDAVARYLPPGSRVADLGAGAGAMSARLLDAGYEVTALDIDPGIFRVRGAGFTRCDLSDPEEVGALAKRLSGTFDAVVAIEVIEHMTDPWRLVDLSRAILRDGGYFFVTTPNVANRVSRVLFLLTGRMIWFDFRGGPDGMDRNATIGHRTGHLHPLTEPELEYILKFCGFRTVETTPVGVWPFITTAFNWKSDWKGRFFGLFWTLSIILTSVIPMGKLKNGPSYLKVGVTR
jgi:SAM-dependent methyltransferase